MSAAEPGLIRSLSGAYRLDPIIDQDVQGWPVYKRGRLFGVYLDDTTPDLETWLAKARSKYVAGLGLTVFVAVASGTPNMHYRFPGVIALYERYIYNMGAPGYSPKPSEWGPVPKGYVGYIVQWNFAGTAGGKPPTRLQRARLLASVLLRHPRFVFLY